MMARKSRKYGDGSGELNITSMLDMFTIILVFLIKQMDTEGQLMTQAENLKLPNSTSQKTPSEVNLTVVVDRGHVLVDNVQVEETDVVLKQDSLFVASMIPILEEKREAEKKAALANAEDAEEAGQIIVQMDKNLEYDVMYKVMATCGWSGYEHISFAVIQSLSEE
jgi:biopolymer transport protein ExbD